MHADWLNEECLECGLAHTLFTGQTERDKEREIKREGGEKEEVKEKEREREREMYNMVISLLLTMVALQIKNLNVFF